MELLIHFYQSFHGVVVGAGVFGYHVSLDATGCGLASVSELADEFVGEKFGRGCGLDSLEEELGGGFSFFNARGELVGCRELATAVIAGEIVLRAAVKAWGAHLLVCCWTLSDVSID